MSNNDKILDLSDKELTTLKFLGSSAAQQVIDLIEAVRKVPTHFKWLTVSQVQCLSTQLKFQPDVPPTSSKATLLFNFSETTAAQPDLVSLFERVHFSTGISEDHPLLLQRSDVRTRPFFIPRERHSVLPEKTAHGANHPVLKNELWKETIAPKIITLLKDLSRDVHVSSMLPVRFSTPDEDGNDVFDNHIVPWISVHPNTTKETSCRDANAEILAILSQHGVQDAAVHWIEGAVEPLVGPPEMVPLVRDTDPTHYIRRALTAVLGLPLAMEANDAQGSLGLLMAITNKHVTSSDTTQDYQYNAGAAQQYIRNCSARRFQHILNETRAFIAEKLGDAQLYAEQLTEILAKPESKHEGEAAQDKEDLRRKQGDLTRTEKDIVQLADFFQLLTSTWSDAYQRIIGWLDWAPKIHSNLDLRRYTRDLGVIALDEDKFKENFKGNIVYLAGKYTRKEINSFFHSNAANAPAFKYPSDHLFRLSGFVDAAGLANPYFSDENNNPGSIVAKHGQATDLTFGRLSELEAHTCDEFEHDSWEVAFLNFSKKLGNFSAKGDSGAAIFNAQGKLVALLHSGMPRGMSNHVTFGMPGHYVVELVKEHYPHADFDRLQFA
ncbi:hypothetical protein V565_150850 [Rhizoctonia solani 123E]|uniref:Serine protease n=1 Tax=Rhizoctonia solani 123E TaxID=1423351 RepID=A0A074RQF7_9AGAM|nr:hypothetical protein V565_150850 [Rhizoctonia solani 123E]